MSALLGRVHGNADLRVALEVSSTAACVRLDVYADRAPASPDANVERTPVALSADQAVDLAFMLLEHSRKLRASQGGGR